MPNTLLARVFYALPEEIPDELCDAVIAEWEEETDEVEEYDSDSDSED